MNASDIGQRLVIKPFSDFICIFGKKGRGKTVFAKFLIKSLSRYIILDHRWQLGDCGYVVNDPQKIFEAWDKWENPHVVYQPTIRGGRVSKADTDAFFSVALSLANYTLIVEEADHYAYPRGWKSDLFEELVNRGRAQGIGIIITTRRPASLHNDIRSNADYVICFHLHHVKDREYVAEWLGIEEEDILSLDAEKFESLVYYDKTGKVWTQEACPYYGEMRSNGQIL